MAYGLSSTLPDQDQELIRIMALRWMRAAGPHNEWAKIGKRCVEMIEGQHWTPSQKAMMQELKRSALTFNMINPLYRLIVGYQSSNRMDIAFRPTNDAVATQDVADVLTGVIKAEGDRMDLKYADTDVFSDGIIAGRGFWDMRLCFENNDFGDMKVTAADPFSQYIDPDSDSYNLDETAAYMQESVWTDVDHINATYGSAAAQAVENLTTATHQSSLLHFLGEQDVSPARYFGQYADDKAMGNWTDVFHTDFIDRQAKRIRLLDSQYRVTQIKPVFIDLETGDREPIPDEWMKPENHHKIEAALSHAEQLGNPLIIKRRPVKRIRWTVSVADVLLFDGWSPYNHYTKVGFFPYFRRGKTRGFVEDLIDPAMEVNKKRSVLNDILNRNANSGWIYEENTLDPEQEANLRKYGATPGINIKWKRAANGTSERPMRIEPGDYPHGLDKLEEKAQMDLYKISGINESSLGQLDKVQSGRAIEARQRQAVLAIQMYQDNFSRSKKLQGGKMRDIVQKHYTEQRVYRVLGEDSKIVVHEINKKIMTGGNAVGRLNDITLGKYSVVVDETPISATFKQGQFEEVMMLLEKLGPIGMALAQTAPDLIIDQTTLPRKDEWKQRLMGATSAAAMAAGPANGKQGAPPALPAPGGPPMPVGPAAGTPEMMAS